VRTSNDTTLRELVAEAHDLVRCHIAKCDLICYSWCQPPPDVETWTLCELFYFWKLAGGRVEASLAEKVCNFPVQTVM
jgi:hypothetical protein